MLKLKLDGSSPVEFFFVSPESGSSCEWESSRGRQEYSSEWQIGPASWLIKCPCNVWFSGSDGFGCSFDGIDNFLKKKYQKWILVWQ